MVGRASCTLKLVGDYVTKFDGPGDSIPGAPKKSMGDIHILPAERPDFKWRIRVNAHSGQNMPLNNVIKQGLPSCYLEFGWNINYLSSNPESGSLLPSAETEKTAMVENNQNPNWNEQILFHNPKNVFDEKSGFFIIQIKDFHK